MALSESLLTIETSIYKGNSIICGTSGFILMFMSIVIWVVNSENGVQNFQANEIFKLNLSVLIYVTSLCIILQVFEAYLESKSKMCIFLLTNRNQNPVVLSLCLVFSNAHVKKCTYFIIKFSPIFTLVENARMHVFGEMTSQVEFSRYRWVFRVL